MKKIRQETHRTTHPLHTKAPWLVLALTLALGNAALGVTRYVAVSGNDANTPYTTWAAPAETIAAAISVATDGDVILVSNGVYTLSSVLTITNAITLRSANGPESTIINAGGVRRAFWIGNVSGATLAGFTITNGYHNILGAGIDMYSGDNLISNCIVRGNHTGPSGIGGGIYFGRNSSGRAVDTLVEGNTAFKGAGILFTNSAASISNCTVIQNQAGIHGGGVYICGDGAVLHSLISENSAFDGGGIYCTGSTAWITGNTISSNVAQRDGAGAYLDFGGTLSNCMITGNAAGTNGFGGGVCIFSSGLVVDSTVAGNNAGFDGGGIYCWEGGHVRNSTIEGNTVDGDGAGIYVYNSTPSATTSSVSSITNCLIQNNACSGFYIGYGRGGGVVLNGDGKVVGSTIQNNQATDAGGGVFIVNCPGAINAADVRGLIDNTAVLANRALRGGGIWAVGGTVRSCTVIDNAAEGFATYAGGMYVTNNAVLVNNIIYYNTANSDPNIRLDSDVYSLYFSCTPVPPTNPAGSGNITAAPGLLDFPDSAHEYHLASNSPCRNAGNNYAWMTTDIDGQPRIQQGLVDMGADEFAPIPGGFNAAAGANATVGEGRPVSFNASASTGGGGSPLRYRWDFGDGSTPGDWQTTPTAEHTYGSAGVYTSKLIVVNNVSLDTDTRIVTVTNVPPIVNAGGPYSTYLNVPLTIAVSAIATGDYNVLKYRFDFNGQGWGAWNTAASSNWTYRTTVGQTNVYVQCGKFMDFMDPYPASTGSAIAVVTVLSNLPPVITALRVAPEENWLDTPLLVSVTAHDPDTNGLLRYSYNWSGAWSGWGASSNMSHTYTNGGAQTVQVRVRDDLGTSTVEQVGMHIIVAEAQGITRSNGHPNISWSVASNRTYLVQCAQDITLGAWSNVSTVITTSLNTLDFLVTNSAPNAIYRSVLTP